MVRLLHPVSVRVYVPVSRDDLVFLIYLYQRWIYRVDMTRVNEFGFSGQQAEEVEAAKAAAAAAAAANGDAAAAEVPALEVSGRKEPDQACLLLAAGCVGRALSGAGVELSLGWPFCCMRLGASGRLVALGMHNAYSTAACAVGGSTAADG